MSSPELSDEALRGRQVELLRFAPVQAIVSGLEPAATTHVQDVDPEPPLPDGYGELARRLYVSYHEALPAAVGEEAELINGENPVSGFDAMARILSFGPIAYAEYCKNRNVSPSLSELTQILRNSYESVSFFMSMRGHENNLYESALAVRGGNPERPTGMFVVAETEQGLKMVPNQERLNYAEEMLAAESESESSSEPWRKCPARTIFGYRLWQRMIDLAASDPELLEADLLRATRSLGLYPQHSILC